MDVFFSLTQKKMFLTLAFIHGRPVESSRVEQADRQTGTAGDHPFGLGWIFGKVSGQRLSSGAAAVGISISSSSSKHNNP